LPLLTSCSATRQPRQGLELNKTEERYLTLLKRQEGIILTQAIRVKIGAVRCWYLPDFAVIRPDGGITFHEVKGAKVWDDARVKFQAAVTLYPQFEWVWAQWKNNQWDISRYANQTTTRGTGGGAGRDGEITAG
jgi:hypothetical protein